MSRERPQTARWGMLQRLWRTPEMRLLVPGFGLSLGWEFLQSPLYADTFVAPWGTVALDRLHCAGGDGAILLAAFWLVALGWGRRWLQTPTWSATLTWLALGLLYTAFSEHYNVYVLQRWAYSHWMPTVAGIGLVPLLQWVMVPLITVQCARQWLVRQEVAGGTYRLKGQEACGRVQA